jgi:sugar phosphate isomerase/epimerase
LTGNRLPGASLARLASPPIAQPGRQRGLRDRLALHETTTYRWSLEEDAHALRAAGFTGIGLWRPKLDDFGDERTAELLEELNITPVSLGWTGGFTGSEGCSFQDAMADASATLWQASEVGARVVLITPGRRGGHTWNHAYRIVSEALNRLGHLAGCLNLQLAVQPALPQFGRDCTYLSTLDRTLELLDRCNHPRVGLNLDLFHLGHDPQLCARIPEFVKYIKTVQLCDAPARPASEYDRHAPGDGTLPLTEIVQALEASGYTGFYELQLQSEQIWGNPYEPLLERCRSDFDALADVVTATTRNPATELLPAFDTLLDTVNGLVI